MSYSSEAFLNDKQNTYENRKLKSRNIRQLSWNIFFLTDDRLMDINLNNR